MLSVVSDDESQGWYYLLCQIMKARVCVVFFVSDDEGKGE